MITSNNSRRRSLLRKIAVVVIGCTVGIALAQFTALKADTHSKPAASDPKAPALPLTPKYEKAADDKGPYVLTLTNTSSAALKLHATVVPSVVFHAGAKTRHLPEEVVAAGKTMVISSLAAADKIELTAEGFAPLELVVP
jgi:hypothetical protein